MAPLFGALLLLLASTRPAAASPPADSLFGGVLHRVSLGSASGFVLEPPPSAPAIGRPWVWYAPTFTGSHPNAACAWYLERLLRAGVWVAGLDIGESYGNPAGRKAFSAFYDTVRARFGLARKALLLPQSRGGLMLYNWAAEEGNAAKVARIAGIYPVGDLQSYPGLAVAAPAYGLTEEALRSRLAEHNPIDRLGPLRDAGIPILHVHGDADALVPLEANSRAIRDRYLALGGSMRLIVVPGKGHAEIPEFFQSRALLDFLLEGAEPTFILGRGAKARTVRRPGGRIDAADVLGRLRPEAKDPETASLPLFTAPGKSGAEGTPAP